MALAVPHWSPSFPVRDVRLTTFSTPSTAWLAGAEAGGVLPEPRGACWGHWQVENGNHFRRDASMMRRGDALDDILSPN